MTLLRSRRFLPLFLTQFLGAFNDNLFKNALAIMILYQVAASEAGAAQVKVTLAAGLFMLPFLLFSATAGEIADRYDRARLARLTKIAEIFLMALASFGFYGHLENFLLFVLFLTGTQATFFGPVKYALLPQHLREGELVAGNGWIEAGTFLAILLGTILGTLLPMRDQAESLIAGGLMLCAGLGYLTSRFIPPAPPPSPDSGIDGNILRASARILGFAREDKLVWRSIIGISWFWLVGATFLAQFPAFARERMHGDETVVTLFLTVFSVGIGAGSMLCARLLKDKVHSGYAPFALLGLSLFTFDLYGASSLAETSDELIGAFGFLESFGHWRILVDLFCIAVCGGVYIVPLYALIQHRSEKEHLARIIAGNNIVNAVFMVASAVMTIALLRIGFSIPEVFLLMAFLNLLVAFYVCALLPEAVLRPLLRWLFRLLYRVEVHGLEHYHEAKRRANGRVLIIVNHVSFLDAPLIATWLPDKITFAINTHMARKAWLKPFLKIVEALPIDPASPLASRAMIDILKAGRPCMAFPEGRITTTGALMKIYEGPAMIADKANALILPVRIDGAQYSVFSRLQGKARLRLFPKVTLTILPAQALAITENLKGRERRKGAERALRDLMLGMMFETSRWRMTLFQGLIEAARTHGGHHLIAEDTERQPLSYRAFLTRCFVLSRLLARGPGREEERIAVLLPTSIGLAVTFFALQARGRVPVMLNFTSTAAQMQRCCQTAQARTVLTSRRFITEGKFEAQAAQLAEAGLRLVYLEDLRSGLTLRDKLAGLISGFLPRWQVRAGDPDAPAVILFTSGSEGAPKGVALSHANLLSNVKMAGCLDLGPQDRMFNCLPMFHAFALTGGMLLPLLSGARTFYYPTPLHYRIIPELIYDTDSTVLFATDTFLAGFARHAHPYDFHSLRYVYAGAEKLKEDTRRRYEEKFGIRVLEGYGATETSPILSANTPMQHRQGTVGKLMPGIMWRLQPVPGIETGGALQVKGPNVMLGYLKSDLPGVVQPLEDGWYDTGDIVRFDAEGFLTIQGRRKRFAKIAGEMVSLVAVEEAASVLWPGFTVAAVSLPDERKGERILLLTNCPQASREALIPHFQSHGLSELALPKRVLILDAVPLLGTGKTDYQAANALALRLEQESSQALIMERSTSDQVGAQACAPAQ